LDKFVKRQAKA